MTGVLLPLLLPQHGLGGAQDLPISRTLAIVGAGIAVAVSLGFGFALYPAWKASRLSAMEALRYE